MIIFNLSFVFIILFFIQFTSSIDLSNNIKEKIENALNSIELKNNLTNSQLIQLYNKLEDQIAKISNELNINDLDLDLDLSNIDLDNIDLSELDLVLDLEIDNLLSVIDSYKNNKSKNNLSSRSISSPMTAHLLRLSPKEDLKLALLNEITALQLPAASIISAVGSLCGVHLRLAADLSVTEDKEKFFTSEECYEIVSLSGTLEYNESLAESNAHIHISLSDKKGAVIGGHLMEGNYIYTTAEIVLGSYPNVIFDRQYDSASGWDELVVLKKKSKLSSSFSI